MNCLLCHAPSFLNINKVFDCTHCGLVFKNPDNHFDLERDLERYSAHNNSTEDLGYIDFLNNLIKPLSNFLPKNFSAIDFGCGPGPSLSILLSRLGGVVENYDPIFLKNEKALLETFDVVTCSEVVEHFKKPDGDWTQLVSLIKPKGLLAIMTLLIGPEINYKSWWYKNDPTHVVFYSEETLMYLAKRFELDIIFNDKKSVIIFRKK